MNYLFYLETPSPRNSSKVIISSRFSSSTDPIDAPERFRNLGKTDSRRPLLLRLLGLWTDRVFSKSNSEFFLHNFGFTIFSLLLVIFSWLLILCLLEMCVNELLVGTYTRRAREGNSKVALPAFSMLIGSSRPQTDSWEESIFYESCVFRRVKGTPARLSATHIFAKTDRQ